jgi:Thrombospondin type 3 repeat
MRLVLGALALAFVTALAGPGQLTAADAPPTITLLAPPNGSTIYSSVHTTDYPTFMWHIDWATPSSVVTITWQIASDTAFTQKVTGENHTCPGTDLNCFSSFQPHAVYGPPYGSVWYWRVGVITTSGIVYSPVWTFTAVNPPDADGDGVPDSTDNCPKTPNADQRDSNHDGKGDACQPDRSKPRVRVSRGSARRGTQAFVTYHVADDRGEVRLRATLEYKTHVLFRGDFGWRTTSWGIPRTFFTQGKIPRFFPVGMYAACVEAWDRARNHARSCAAYRIT